MNDAKARRREETWVTDSARALGPAVDKALLLLQHSTGIASRQTEQEDTEELPRIPLGIRRVF